MSEPCFLCGRGEADPARAVKVTLRRDLGGSPSQVQFKLTDVAVPACAACRSSELAARRRAAGAQLACLVVGTLLGWAGLGGGQGAVLGFGVGFFSAFVVGAVLSSKRRCDQHPKVQELLRAGWRVYTPN